MSLRDEGRNGQFKPVSRLRQGHVMGAHLGQTNIPPTMRANLRQNRMTALQKPQNGVRGIVVGDVKLVARKMAQQLKQTSPPLYNVHKTKTEYMAHWHTFSCLQRLTLTIVTIRMGTIPFRGKQFWRF